MFMDSNSGVKERVDHLHTLAKNLIKNKVAETQILKELLKEGINENYALTIIQNVKSDIDDKKEFWKLLFMGTFFVIGGLVINYYSYKIAENGNSFFFYLFWGIVVTGIVLIIRAFILFKN
jgi:uncharacterized membrane protein